jgi:hypothetical protein
MAGLPRCHWAGIYAAGVVLLNARALRFFALAFALTWVWWLPMLAEPQAWQPLHYVGSLGPMVAAFILAASEGGRPGIRDLSARMVRLAPPWLLVAVAVPTALYLVGVSLSWAMGQPIDSGEFLGSKEYQHVGWLLVPIEIFFFGYGEEVGWRGYALHTLQQRRGECLLRNDGAGGVLGSVAPAAVFYPYGLGTLSPWMVPGWLLSLLFGAYLTTWLYLSSGCSLLVVAVFHGVVDLVSLTPASSTITLVTVNAGLIAAAVAVVIRYAPTLSAGDSETA